MHRTGGEGGQLAECRVASAWVIVLPVFNAISVVATRNNVSSTSNRFHVNPQADIPRINAYSIVTLVSWSAQLASYIKFTFKHLRLSYLQSKCEQLSTLFAVSLQSRLLLESLNGRIKGIIRHNRIPYDAKNLVLFRSIVSIREFRSRNTGNYLTSIELTSLSSTSVK